MMFFFFFIIFLLSFPGWQLSVGDVKLGPRLDKFNKEDWTYRYGITWDDFARVSTLKNCTADDDSITVTIEVLDEPVVDATTVATSADQV
mgnify:CR=1 FL=1